MNTVIRFLTDYQGRLTDNVHFDRAGDIVDRYNVSTCLLLVEAGVAEYVVADDAPPVEEPTEAPQPKRTRKKATA